MEKDITISMGIVEELHEALMQDVERLDYIKANRGVSLDTIKNYLLGYEHKSGRYIIPIFNEKKECVNLRKWKPKETLKEGEAKILSVAGHGEGRIYPIENIIKDKVIYLCEGEWDCLILNQYGYNAVTNTIGCATWKEDWTRLFKGKDVIIVYDCDKPGKDGAEKVSYEIFDMVASTKIVDLGLEDKGDVSDFFVKLNKTRQEFNKIVKDTPDKDYYSNISLWNSLNAEYFGKKVKFQCIVIGKDLSPYIVPKKVKLTCRSLSIGKDRCYFCSLYLSKGYCKEAEYTFDRDKETLIKFIGSSDTQLNGYIRRSLHIPDSSQCRSVQMEILERQNIEDISVIPNISLESMENNTYTIRQCFCMGDGITTNETYTFKGTTWADPNNQQGIHIIKTYESAKNHINNFELSKDIIESMSMFKPTHPDKEESIYDKLKDIYTDMVANVTRIIKRNAVMFATDLVYHSVLQFKFQNRKLTKGWLEATVFGDTRTGKTETIRSMCQHYKLGEFISSAENSTLAGILGGVQQQANGRWSVTWGKIVINNGGIAILDEADRMKEQGILSALSGIRSSGIAEIVKIQPQRTSARTRLIFISNPPTGHSMDEHNFGVDALRQLFGAPQDIARIDLAVACSSGEVSLEEMNSFNLEGVEHKYTSEVCRNLILYAWNRKPEHIIFSAGVEEYIMQKAIYFGGKYDESIPICLGAEMRVKIAKMAVSLAVRLFNTIEGNYEVIEVNKAHVSVVCDFLEKQYDNDIMGFNEYSQGRKKNRSITSGGEIDHIFDILSKVSLMLDTYTIRREDIDDIFQTKGEDTKHIVSLLRKNNCVVKSNTYYKKTATFIKYLHQRKKELGAVVSEDNIPF